MRAAIGLAGLAAAAFLAACTQIGETQPPQVHLTDIRMLGGGLLEQRFQVDLRIGNPNDFDLPLDGLTFELELNDQLFAQGFTDETVTVPRLGEARLPVVASTTLIDVMQQVMTLGQHSDLSYRIAGVVYLRGLGRRQVPYERSGKMGLLPKVPSRPAERTLVPL